MNGLPLPVLAIDIPEIFGIIFLVLSVLGWFVKAIKGQAGNAAPPPVRRQQPPNVRRSEIETFLEEISGGQVRKPPARATPPNRPANKPRLENVAAAKKPTKSSKVPKPPKPVAALADQHLAKSNVGEGLRSHVSVFIKQEERISAEVRQDLKNRMEGEVRSDLGSKALAPAPTVQRPQAHPLVALLRNPEGIRQAITLQEILQPPKALRRR